MLAEMPGFVADMDRSAGEGAGTWTPRPILLAMAEPNGPVDRFCQGSRQSSWPREVWLGYKPAPHLRGGGVCSALSAGRS